MYRLGLEDLNKRIRAAHEASARRERLQRKVEATRQRVDELRSKLDLLELDASDEQADVDKLEGKGLRSLFAGIFGDKESRLEKERAEALAARVRHDEAEFELEAQRGTIAAMELEITELSTASQELDALVGEMERWVRDNGGPDGDALLELDAEARQLEALNLELVEACDAGGLALKDLDELEAPLASASKWGQLDLVTSNLFITLAKQSKLKDVKGRLSQVQIALSAFEREIADLGSELQIGLDVEPAFFSGIGDYVLDIMFVNLSVQTKIDRSLAGVGKTREHVAAIMRNLEDRRVTVKTRQENLGTERETVLARWS